MTNRRSTIISLALLLAITVAIFADLLFSGGTRVPGHPASDLSLQYFAWRKFGFDELAKGNLALWNPHIFSGAPYLGGMQGAQLYPPNWLFLLLSTPIAIRWTVALHVVAIGAFMFGWMRQRGLAAAPSFFAGMVVSFCGAFFPHVFAGHLPQLCTMAWAPLVFCAIDGFFETRRIGWVLIGIVAVAMQVLAGFPQYLFYTAIAAALYCALRLANRWDWRAASGLPIIYVGGATVAAIQLLPSIQTMRETTRGLRLPFQFASMVAFPPENFVSLFAPDFLGQIDRYWGRWYLWETSAFVGVVTLVFAVYAVVTCEKRTKWPAVVLVVVSFLLALGSYTPLFGFLYNWVPGFDRFRSVSKFIFPASLFLVALAATGVDRWLHTKRTSTGFITVTLAVALLLGAAGWYIATVSNWSAVMEASRMSGQSYLLPQRYADPSFVSAAQQHAATSLVFAAAICATLGIVLLASRRYFLSRFAIIGLAAVEMISFAYRNYATFDSDTIVSQKQVAFLKERPGDYRIMNVANPNTAMIVGAQDLWGYDATVVRRYAEFMTWTQGGDPNNAMSYVKFVQFDPLFAMLRQSFVFAQRGTEFEWAEAPVPPLPHLQLVSKYRVISTRDAIFDALRSATFDPKQEVILESEPQPTPASGIETGSAEIVSSSTDALTIRADVEKPSILLVTDAYTSSWRARPMPESTQSSYQVLPANYILRAIPLNAGHHLFRLEYVSTAFAIGKWISLAAVAAFVFVLARFRKHQLFE